MAENKDKTEEPLGRFEEIDFNFFECPQIYIMDLLWDKNRKKTIFILILSVGVSLLLLFLTKNPVLLACGIFIFGIYCAKVEHGAEFHLMEQFALNNNLKYQRTIPLSDVAGNLFKIGDSRAIIHVFTGSYSNQKTRLFYYQYNTGSVKTQAKFKFTVLEIFFEKTEFPHILLVPTKNILFKRYGKIEKGEIKINLEDEFKNDYNLFTKKGYEIEVMQIFTPEFLRFLKESNFFFSIEFKENRMYIYNDVFMLGKGQLQEILKVVYGVFNKIGPLLNRLENDFSAIHPYFKNKR